MMDADGPLAASYGHETHGVSRHGSGLLVDRDLVEVPERMVDATVSVVVVLSAPPREMGELQVNAGIAISDGRPEHR